MKKQEEKKFFKFKMQENETFHKNIGTFYISFDYNHTFSPG
jgi:hypothetical protein